MVLFTLSAEKIKISANENVDIATECEQGLSLSLNTPLSIPYPVDKMLLRTSKNEHIVLSRNKWS